MKRYGSSSHRQTDRQTNKCAAENNYVSEVIACFNSEHMMVYIYGIRTDSAVACFYDCQRFYCCFYFYNTWACCFTCTCVAAASRFHLLLLSRGFMTAVATVTATASARSSQEKKEMVAVAVLYDHTRTYIERRQRHAKLYGSVRTYVNSECF